MTIMETRSDYRYEAYDTPEAKQIRIPQQEWLNGAPHLGANGLPILFVSQFSSKGLDSAS